MYAQHKNKLYNFDNNIKKIFFEFELMLTTYLFLASIYFYYFF